VRAARAGFTSGQIGAKIGGMMAPARQVKITFAEMREQGVRGPADLLHGLHLQPLTSRASDPR
jgi:hypothetical protein